MEKASVALENTIVEGKKKPYTIPGTMTVKELKECLNRDTGINDSDRVLIFTRTETIPLVMVTGGIGPRNHGRMVQGDEMETCLVLWGPIT